MAENPNATLPSKFCQWNFHDDMQPFFQTDRLTSSYTYDFMYIQSVHVQFSMRKWSGQNPTSSTSEICIHFGISTSKYRFLFESIYSYRKGVWKAKLLAKAMVMFCGPSWKWGPRVLIFPAMGILCFFRRMSAAFAAFPWAIKLPGGIFHSKKHKLNWRYEMS